MNKHEKMQIRLEQLSPLLDYAEKNYDAAMLHHRHYMQGGTITRLNELIRTCNLIIDQSKQLMTEYKNYEGYNKNL